MRLSIDMLFDKMDPFSVRPYTDADADPSLDRPKLISSDPINDRSVLYVGCAKDIPDINTIESGISVVSIGAPPGFSTSVPINFNLLIIDGEEVELETVFNKIIDLFVSFNQWEVHMQDMLLSNSPLQDFIDASDEVLGWPISIIDRAEKTLAVSRFEDSDDIIWKEICSGYIRTELLLKDSVKISEIMQYSKPVQRYSTVSDRIILSQSIRISGHVVGFVATHHPKRSKQLFSHGVEQLVNYFTGFIAKRMRNDEFYNMSRGSMFEYLLVDLIEGHINNEALIADRLLFFKWNPDKNKVLIRTEAPQNKLNYLRDYMFRIVPQNHSIIYGGGVVTIVSGLEVDGLSSQILEQLRSSLAENNAVCGISNTYSSLTETEKHYGQTQIAITFGKIQHPNLIVYRYPTYALHHAISILSQHTDITDYYHAAFKRLLPLTKTNQFLFDTLWIYLQTNCNIAASAKLLFIHRNSMIYRIKRLEDELQIDFMNPEDRLHLSISFEIYNYIQRFDANSQELHISENNS
ncbi:MAG: PucR family transcriptional regulator [Christensenellales bacterium]